MNTVRNYFASILVLVCLVTFTLGTCFADESPSVWFTDNSGNKLFDAQCNVGESVYRMIYLPYSGDVKSVIVQGQKTNVTDLGYMDAGDHTTYILTGPGDEGSTALSYILLNDHPSNKIKLYIQPPAGGVGSGPDKCYTSPDGKTYTCVSPIAGPCEWTQTNVLGIYAWVLTCNPPSPYQYSYGAPGLGNGTIKSGTGSPGIGIGIGGPGRVAV